MYNSSECSNLAVLCKVPQNIYNLSKYSNLAMKIHRKCTIQVNVQIELFL